MKRSNVILALIMSLFTAMSATADEITMKLESTCGFDTHDLQVEIWNPPGGYAKVASDKSVKVNVPAGHKLSAGVAPSYCENEKNCTSTCANSPRRPENCAMPYCIERCTEMSSQKLLGPWTEAKDGGVIKVECNR